MSFLQDIAGNNNREWFHANADRYEAARQEFLDCVDKAILRLSKFDLEVSHLSPKDCVFRFYRDIRFSPDKSPYKRHFGAYICRRGKKSLQGGYYIHLQPDNCFLAVGSYWLPTNILTSCRNEIMSNIDVWRQAVENERFVGFFGRAGENEMTDYTDCDLMPPKGFGTTHLKKSPKGFPADYKYVNYLKMKDYCCWRHVDDRFFEGDSWIEPAMEIFSTAKPATDFMNAVIADYEP